MIIRMNGQVISQPTIPIKAIAADFVRQFSAMEKLVYSISASLVTYTPALTAFAAGVGATPDAHGKIVKAFEPIMTMLTELAGPVCRIMFILGFVLVIIGKPRQGIDKMKWAAIGYVGIQWTPMLMGIVEKAGETA